MVDPDDEEIMGESAHSAALRQFIREAGRSSFPVVLLGEPGVGKELVARRIHHESSRRKHPFLMIDCSLYYERELKREVFGSCGLGDETKARKGMLEFASKGTCYLSRIEELSTGLQDGLLEFLRTGCFKRLGDGRKVCSRVRLIVSSDKNLVGFVEGGLFNEELYAELSRLAFKVAPLRERVEDIHAAVRSLVDSYRREHCLESAPLFTRDALEALECFPWPRNFDELKKEVRRLLENGHTAITSEVLSFEICTYWRGQRGDPEVRKVIEELEGYIREFKVLSRLDAEFGDVLLNLSDWEKALQPGSRHLSGTDF
jgi:DNA-binding NtrC family response regulator